MGGQAGGWVGGFDCRVVRQAGRKTGRHAGRKTEMQAGRQVHIGVCINTSYKRGSYRDLYENTGYWRVSYRGLHIKHRILEGLL